MRNLKESFLNTDCAGHGKRGNAAHSAHKFQLPKTSPEAPNPYYYTYYYKRHKPAADEHTRPLTSPNATRTEK